MGLEIGSVMQGKVTGITKFGAFVALPEGKSGMVHISEVANTFVNNISDFLKEGQEVCVKVLNVDQAGRINLSIKKALPPDAAQQQRPAAGGAPFTRRAPRPRTASRAPRQPVDPASMTFEDKLKHFMADSESRMADIRRNSDKKSGVRRRK